MSNRSDATLVIRARDEATKSIDNITRILKQLEAAQAAAAAGGTGAASGIKAQVAAIEQVSAVYDRLQASLKSAEEAFARQGKAVAAQRDELAALKKQAEAAAQAIVSAEIGLRQGGGAGAATRVDAARKAYGDLIRDIARLESTLGAQTGATSRSAADLDRIRSAAAAAGAALRGFGTEAERAAIQAAAIAEAQRAAAAGEAAAIRARQNPIGAANEKAAAELARLVELERLGVITAAELAGEQARVKAALDAQIASLNGTAAAAKVAADAERQMATEAAALRAQLDPIGAATERAAQQIARFQELVRAGKLDPGLASRGNDAVNQRLAREIADLDGTAAANRAAAKAADDAAAAQKRMAAEAAALRGRLDPAKAAQESFNEEIRRARDLFTAGEISARTFRQALRDIGARAAESRDQLTGRAAAAKAAADADAALAAAIQRLRDANDPAAAIQRRYNQALAEANDLRARGKITATELATAEARLAADAKRATDALAAGARGREVGLFGLRPHELQNLGYQVNDLATQIASGTSATQALAQQAGQIIQIFPRVGAAIFGALPYVAAFAAAVAPLYLGASRALDLITSLRGFSGELAASADGAATSAEAMLSAALAIEKLGVSLNDARGAVSTFRAAGFSEELFGSLGEIARDTADVLRIDFADAVKLVASALSGGFDGVRKLDDATQAYSATQLETIRLMFEEGRAGEARSLALRIFSEQMDGAADKSVGPWQRSMRELNSSWKSFLDTLSQWAIVEGMTTSLQGLAVEAGKTLRVISGAQTADDLDRLAKDRIERYKLGIETFRREADGATRYRRRDGSPEAFGDRATEINDALDRRDAARRQAQQDSGRGGSVGTIPGLPGLGEALDRAIGQSRELTDTINEQSEARRKLRDEAKAEIDIERAIVQARREGNFAKLEELQGEKAYRAEIRRTGDAEIAQSRRQLAVDQERTNTIRAQQAASEKAARDADKRNREAISDNGRRGLLSTARQFNGQTERGNRDDLMAFFKTAGINVDPTMVAWCAAFVNAVLNANGLPGTGSLKARDFLGYGQDATSNPKEGDIVVLRQPGGTDAQGHVGFFKGFDASGNVRVLGGNQSDGVNTQTFKSSDVLGIRRAPSAGDVAQDQFKAQQQADKQQAEFNARLDDENRKRRETITALERQNGLRGEALIAEQRQQVIADAILQKEQEIAKLNRERARDGLPLIEFAKEQRAEIERTTGALFDLQNARNAATARRDSVQQPVDDLLTLRSQLMAQIDLEQQRGNTGSANVLTERLNLVNEQLSEAIEKAREFYETLDPTNNALGLTAEQIEAIKLKLDTANASATQWNYVLGISGQQIAQTFASGATNALDGFAKSIASGENAIKSLGRAFLQFAADFLRQIAIMIAEQAIFNAISGAFSAGAGASPGTGGFAGGPGAGTGAIGGIQLHDGGIVGAGGTSRAVMASWFNNARRYHTGGVAGLAPNEVPAVLERGEEVLTRNDPRHVANGGGTGGDASERWKILNLFDSNELASQMLNSREGERAVINIIRSNPTAVNGALNGR